MAISLWVIDYRDGDYQPHGKIIQPWIVHEDEPPGPRYADYCALYNVWGVFTDEPPEVVGFFGYRKYLVPPDMALPAGTAPAHAPGWWQCGAPAFDRFREDYAHNDGAAFLPLLATHDILVAPPFPLNGDSVWSDFAKSRSPHDAAACASIVPWSTSEQIYPYLFITRWPVFNRAMREMEPLRIALDHPCIAQDSKDAAYSERPMAYVMERVWSLWLEHSGLSVKHLPLLHCWEKQP